MSFFDKFSRNSKLEIALEIRAKKVTIQQDKG